jgi:hypothetical protein
VSHCADGPYLTIAHMTRQRRCMMSTNVDCGSAISQSVEVPPCCLHACNEGVDLIETADSLNRRSNSIQMFTSGCLGRHLAASMLWHCCVMEL